MKFYLPLFLIFIFKSLAQNLNVKPVYTKEFVLRTRNSPEIISDSLISFYANLLSDSNLNKYQKTIFQLSQTKSSLDSIPVLDLFHKNKKELKALLQAIKNIDDSILLNDMKNYVHFLDSIHYFKTKTIRSEEINNKLELYEIMIFEDFSILSTNKKFINYFNKYHSAIYEIQYPWFCNKHQKHKKCFIDSSDNRITYFHFTNKANYYEVFNKNNFKTLYYIKKKDSELLISWYDNKILKEKRIVKKSKIKNWNYFPNGSLKSFTKSIGQSKLYLTSKMSETDSIPHIYYKNRELNFTNCQYFYIDNGKKVKFHFYSKTEIYDTSGRKIDTIIEKE